MVKGYQIIGTDTDVGKTVVSSALIYSMSQQGLRVAGFKPVAAGCELQDGQLRNADAMAMMKYASVELPYEQVNPYAFEQPVAPNIAARHVSVEIQTSVIMDVFREVAAQTDWLIVEGAGGLHTPLNDHQTYVDVAVEIALPVILVVNIRVGCINHALLTVDLIRSRNLEFKGWIANITDSTVPFVPEQIDTIRRYLDVPLIGLLPPMRNPKPELVTMHLSIDQLV